MATANLASKGHQGFFVFIAVLTLASWVTLTLWSLSPYASSLSQTMMLPVPSAINEQMQHAMQFMPWMEMPQSGGAPQALPILTVTFAAAWILMVLGMMLPTIFPLLMESRKASTSGNQKQGKRSSSVLLGGFLSIWIVLGFAVFFVRDGLEWLIVHVPGLLHDPFIVPAVAIGGCGLYQFTGLKSKSLAKCRLSSRSECFACATTGESFALGLHHGIYSIGSCGILMLLMLAANLGSVPWMAVFTGMMLVERYAPETDVLSKGLGLGLTGAAFIYGVSFLL